ncbi:sugar ABC transporter substrate-binding protein [Kineococcus glutinatus]|uniref:Sugar ABC transporter substrate-binding protein n=1 Tax=Kineococcus glutinatus TaxID=1070872 RepID=A0ABP9HKS7_9ACTN
MTTPAVPPTPPARTTPPRPARRAVLGAGAGLAATGALSACSGFSTGGDSSDDASGDATGGSSTQLTMLTWAGDAEAKAFQALADGFEAQSGTTVKIQVVPYSEILTAVDTGLRTPTPPDLFRVSYTDVGVYREQGVLAELPDAGDLEGSFLPAFWSAVTDDDGTYGIPQHTDTSMLLLNTAAVASAGIGALPTSPDDAWTWEQFTDVLGRIRPTRADTFAFAANWQRAGAFRWLNFVDQAGGRLLTEDLTDVAADDPGLLKALTYTRDLFRNGLVPPSGAARGQAASDLFTNQTVATCFGGDFLLPDFEAAGFEYTATFLPRDVNASADLGGNALVAVQDSPNREAALEFLRYCAGQQQVADFCAATTVLPTRSDIDPASLQFAVRPDLMRLYVQQAEAIRTELVEQVVVPSFNAVNAQLRDRLDEAFLGSDDDTTALRKITDGVRSVLQR